jgi:hypothetical protein
MDLGLLRKLLGSEQQWQGACTIILDAEATVQAVGADAMGAAGMKNWAPRTISGRITADAVCMLRDGTAIVMLQQLRTKTATGEEVVKFTLNLSDPGHVVAIEFTDNVPHALTAIGLMMPPVKTGGSHPGTQSKPKPIMK